LSQLDSRTIFATIGLIQVRSGSSQWD